MKFIIYIANRLRQGQFPRLSDFPYNEELQKYVYGGKLLDVQEFNEACEKVFDANYRSSGFIFRPQAVIEAEITQPIKTPVVEETPQETPSDSIVAPSDAVAAGWTLENDIIYCQGERVGSLVDGVLRMAKGKSSMRDDAEQFLLTIVK